MIEKVTRQLHTNNSQKFNWVCKVSAFDAFIHHHDFINLFICYLPGSSFYFYFLPPALCLIERNNLLKIVLNKTTMHAATEGVEAVDWYG